MGKLSSSLVLFSLAVASLASPVRLSMNDLRGETRAEKMARLSRLVDHYSQLYASQERPLVLSAPAEIREPFFQWRKRNHASSYYKKYSYFG